MMQAQNRSIFGHVCCLRSPKNMRFCCKHMICSIFLRTRERKKLKQSERNYFSQLYRIIWLPKLWSTFGVHSKCSEKFISTTFQTTILKRNCNTNKNIASTLFFGPTKRREEIQRLGEQQYLPHCTCECSDKVVGLSILTVEMPKLITM